jgi:hypothetical protein
MGERWLKIREFWSKIESLRTEFLTAVLLILVALGAFGLGRLSALESSRPEVKILSASALRSEGDIIETNNDEINNKASTPPLNEGGKVIASKTGTKYHLPWCSGAKTIKEENKIWFDSYQDARDAGYLPASNCKGIE